MTQLVTLEDARSHLRIDSYADDNWLDMMNHSISGAVLSWLKDSWRAYETQVDSNGDPIEDSHGDQYPATDASGENIVKPQVKAAVLVELAQQYRFRDGVGAAYVPQQWGHGYVLGIGATGLLVSLRSPSTA